MIKDFGEKIDGAAKDRWQNFADRLAHIPDREVMNSKLSDIFPEPSYKAMLRDGADLWSVSFLRAARDSIPPRPRASWKIPHWTAAAIGVRKLCLDLLEGRIDKVRMQEKLHESRSLANLAHATELYIACGHERSLSDMRILQNSYDLLDGVRHSPPLKVWELAEVQGKGRARVLLRNTDKSELMAEIPALLGAQPQTRTRKSVFNIYRRPPDTAVIIGKVIGKNSIDLETFSDVKSARAYLAQNADALEEKWQALRRLPDERRAANRDRTGPTHSEGNVSPEEFDATFGFRGVQFGNYVDARRRQEDLNRAHDALLDLAGVLGVPARALSLGGQLALAFGARGRGGIRPAAAHYEPDQIVINLTKQNGAGSLAHEWFHALDNAVAREAGRRLDYASISGPSLPNVGPLRTLRASLGALPLIARSRQLDRMRSDPYWATGHEVCARAFESWIIAKLEEKSQSNDYLANITPEEVYQAEAALLGIDHEIYPYPKKDEMDAVSRAFERLVASFTSNPAFENILGAMELPAEEPSHEPAESQALTVDAKENDNPYWDDDLPLEF